MKVWGGAAFMLRLPSKSTEYDAVAPVGLLFASGNVDVLCQRFVIFLGAMSAKGGERTVAETTICKSASE
jgi:hypothetical protein